MRAEDTRAKLRSMRVAGRIPREEFLERKERTRAILLFDRDRKVPIDEFQEVVRVVRPAENLAEDPRIFQSPAADHDRVGITVLDLRRRVFRSENVPVADDGNGARSSHLADQLPVAAPTVPLRA